MTAPEDDAAADTDRAPPLKIPGSYDLGEGVTIAFGEGTFVDVALADAEREEGFDSFDPTLSRLDRADFEVDTMSDEGQLGRRFGEDE